MSILANDLCPGVTDRKVPFLVTPALLGMRLSPAIQYVPQGSARNGPVAAWGCKAAQITCLHYLASPLLLSCHFFFSHCPTPFLLLITRFITTISGRAHNSWAMISTLLKKELQHLRLWPTNALKCTTSSPSVSISKYHAMGWRIQLQCAVGWAPWESSF